MMIVQIAGSPFDRSTLLVLETDDGVQQDIYVSNDVVDILDGDVPVYSTEVAVNVTTNIYGIPLADAFSKFRDSGAWSHRTIILVQE